MGGVSHHPHDAFFKRLLGAPETAGVVLRERLPPAVAAVLAPEPPERVPGSFVDARLAAAQADLLFRVRTITGDRVFLYALIERKSRPDPLVAFQLLRYRVRLWEAWLRDRTGPRGRRRGPLRLPPMVPMVLYSSVPVGRATPAGSGESIRKSLGAVIS